MIKLYFVGGASGSGKTAIKSSLREKMGDLINVVEIDDFKDVSYFKKTQTNDGVKKQLSYCLVKYYRVVEIRV